MLTCWFWISLLKNHLCSVGVVSTAFARGGKDFWLWPFCSHLGVSLASKPVWIWHYYIWKWSTVESHLPLKPQIQETRVPRTCIQYSKWSLELHGHLSAWQRLQGNYEVLLNKNSTFWLECLRTHCNLLSVFDELVTGRNSVHPL